MSKKLSRRSFMQRVAKLAASLSIAPQVKFPESIETKPSEVDDDFIPVDHLDKEGRVMREIEWGPSPYFSADYDYTCLETLQCHEPGHGKDCLYCHAREWPNVCHVYLRESKND